MGKKKEKNIYRISLAEIRGYAESFMDRYSPEYSRERSYDFVHSLFAKYIANPPDEEKRDAVCDFLALNLYMFLSSWGMLRNSFLLETNYKCMIGVCDLVLSKKWLCDVRIYAPEFVGKEQRYVDEVFTLAEDIRRLLDKVGQHEKTRKDGTAQHKGVTNTLVTKIMLVTLGCVPAYDENARIALSDMGLSTTVMKDYTKKPPKKITSEDFEKQLETEARQSIRDILDFAMMRKEDLENVMTEYDAEKKKTNEKIGTEDVSYSVMKYVDMVLWERGAALSSKKKKAMEEKMTE